MLGDLFRNRLKESSIIVIGTIINKKPNLMCAVTDDLICKVSASDIIKKIAPIIDGSGGGKNHFHRNHRKLLSSSIWPHFMLI